MNLRTFTAPDMPRALALVRRALGPSAVILHTRTTRRPGLLGMLRRPVVEITAADKALVDKYRRRKQGGVVAAQASAPRPSRAASGRAAVPPTAPVGKAATAGAAGEGHRAAGDLIRKTYAAAMAQMQRQQPAAAPVPSATAETGPPAAGAPATPALATIAPATQELAQEMRAVRRLVAQVLQRQGPVASAALPAALADHYLALLRQEVSQELADEIVEQVRGELSAAQLADPVLVRQSILRAVAGYIPVDSAAGKLLPTADRRPRTIALIGPTGVGKTTTLAKLAATFKLRDKKSVGLITLDTYRIAAVEQLRTYAQIIGVPLHVVANADELRAALRRTAGCDVVLIDTAGRSQRDDPRLEQLSGLLRVADPHEVHLVLSSTSTQSVLLQAAERFSRLRAERIIFTKLDEAVSFGVLLNVARIVNKQLSFVTTGQEVPHHIEPGRPQRLAALVLGEGV